MPAGPKRYRVGTHVFRRYKNSQQRGVVCGHTETRVLIKWQQTNGKFSEHPKQLPPNHIETECQRGRRLKREAVRYSPDVIKFATALKLDCDVVVRILAEERHKKGRK